MRPDLALTDVERARVERIDALVASGAVDELVAALSERSWTVRRAVIAGLASLGDDAVAVLCRWLRTVRDGEHAIAGAVDALVASIGHTTNRVVAGMVDDPDPAVIADAAVILGRRVAHEELRTLERLVRHPDDNVAVAATEAIGTIGGTTVTDTLIAVIQRREFFRTFPAIQVLGRSADARAIAPLASLLTDDTFRYEAARALGRTGLAQAVTPIASLIGDDDAQVRLAAVALADLTGQARWVGSSTPVESTLRAVLKPSLARFVAVLPGADETERTALAAVLGKIGDATTISTLAKLLEEPKVAPAAVAAIQNIGRDHEDALIEALREGEAAMRIAILPVVGARRSARRVRTLLVDEDAEVRARACEALARIGDVKSVPVLFGMLADPSPRVAHAAAGAIQSLGVAEVPALVLATIASGVSAVRRHGLRIAGYLGQVEAFEAIVAATTDADPRTVEAAVGALGMLDEPRTEAMLVTLACSPVPILRAAAMRAAGKRSSPAMIDLLERGLSDPAPWVRYYACRGIGEIGRESAAPLLIERLADEVPHIRIAAIESLSRFPSQDAWEALSRAARSSDLDERRAALVGISGHTAHDAIPLLAAAAGDPDPATQLIAISGLATKPGPLALEYLARAARSADPSLRDAALSLLADRKDLQAARVLLDLAIGSPPEHVVHQVVSRSHPTRIAAISDRLMIASEAEVAVLVPALARMSDAAATGALFAALSSINPSARRSAAVTLVAMAANGARGAVARMAVEDPDPDVRRACAAAVG